jgi:hypothetical protein
MHQRAIAPEIDTSTRLKLAKPGWQALLVE